MKNRVSVFLAKITGVEIFSKNRVSRSKNHTSHIENYTF